MLWNSFSGYFCDITIGYNPKVGKIGLTGFSIPFRTKNALITKFIKWNAYATYACKKVDKRMLGMNWGRKGHFIEFGKQIQFQGIIGGQYRIKFFLCKLLNTFFMFQILSNKRQYL